MKVKVPSFLKSVKYTLAAVNGVFLFTGLMLLVVGVVVLVIYSQYSELITNRFFTIPSFVIATGAIIIIISALGFYAAYSKQFYFIASYTILLIVVLVFEISIVIIMFQLKNSSPSDIRSTMIESMNQYDSRIETAQLWDDLHSRFECCGVLNNNDWASNRIPVSCCHIDYGTISPFECTRTNAFNTGCSILLVEWLSYSAHVASVFALIVTCLQVPITLIAGWMTWRSKFEEVSLES